jgi:YHS domain-containing protein
MEWLTQNWIWLLLMFGVVVMMTRGGMGCGHMGGGSTRDGRSTSTSSNHETHTETTAMLDPVSGVAVNPDGAVSSGYQGRLYYFATRANRELFEQSPQLYSAAGGSADPEPEAHRHHRHGC